MGDMGDMWREIKEANKVERANQEPKALKNAKDSLFAGGFKVSEADPWSLKIWLKNGKAVYYWPFNGWFQGAGVSGRGFKALKRALEPFKS